jgi:hypothetical protein
MGMNRTDQGLDKGHQQNFPGNQGGPDKGNQNRQDDQRKQQNQNPNQGGQYNQGRPGDRANQGDKGGGNQPNR